MSVAGPLGVLIPQREKSSLQCKLSLTDRPVSRYDPSFTFARPNPKESLGGRREAAERMKAALPARTGIAERLEELISSVTLRRTYNGRLRPSLRPRLSGAIQWATRTGFLG
jgi:hypothetical protein